MYHGSKGYASCTQRYVRCTQASGILGIPGGTCGVYTEVCTPRCTQVSGMRYTQRYVRCSQGYVRNLDVLRGMLGVARGMLGVLRDMLCVLRGMLGVLRGIY